MKILLYGDYSSLHFHLRTGLRAIGHDTKIASDSSGILDLRPDVFFNDQVATMYKRIKAKTIEPMLWSRKTNGIDVVQFINPLAISPRVLPAIKYVYKNLFRASNKRFLLSTGNDAVYITKGINQLKYSPIPDSIKHDGNGCLIWLKKNNIEWNYILAKSCDGIIPTSYDYACGYRVEQFSNLKRTIPLPFDISSVEIIPEKRGNRKLKVFHGISRPGFKGTKYILDAFNYLKISYPNDVECITVSNVPLKEYLTIMRECDICVDQALSYGYGMNAIYALAQGLTVLSGAEPETLDDIGIKDCPIINITPNAQQIIETIESLIQSRSSFGERRFKNRMYVEKHHDCVNVALKYLEAWKE